MKLDPEIGQDRCSIGCCPHTRQKKWAQRREECVFILPCRSTGNWEGRTIDVVEVADLGSSQSVRNSTVQMKPVSDVHVAGNSYSGSASSYMVQRAMLSEIF